jgi:hypothetical protein
MVSGKSIKYEWHIASSADIRWDGLHTRSFWSKSRPFILSFGTTWAKLVFEWYKGNGLKSGNCVTPGHESSVGVPNSLKILLSWSSTSLPGNRGRPAFASSANIQPADQQSIDVVYSFAPNKTSGGLYLGFKHFCSLKKG